MKKNKKLIAVLSLFTLMFVTILASYVLSAFAVNSVIESGFGTGEVKYESTEIFVDGTNSFTQPGDKVNGTFSIKNTGDTPFKYSFAIDLTREDPLEVGEVGIENAIFVYADDVYLGRLTDLTSDKYIHNVYFPLTPLDRTIHKLTFEYHIDANADYSKGIKLSVGVEAVSALNYDGDFVFVNNYNALQQYARKSNYQGRTIVLTNDIVLEKDVELKVDCNINLNSHKFNLNGHKLTFNGAGIVDVVKIQNRVDADPSRIGYFSSNSNPNSKVIINTPNGLVLDYTNCEYIDVVAYSKVKLAETYASYLTNATENGIISDMNITDGFAPYFTLVDGLNLNSPSPSIDFVLNTTPTVMTMQITRLDLTQDEPVLVIANDVFREINVRVWGNNDDSAIDMYLSNVVGFTTNYLVEKDAYAVSSDIYLPKKIQSLGATIIWRSSIPEVISTEGKVVRPYKNALSNVELTAYITCNGVTTTRTYNLFVNKKTAEEILKEIIYELESLLTFAYVYESKDNENVRELFTEADYSHLGVVELEYLDIKDIYEDIFKLKKDAPSLELIRDTVLSEAELGLKITVDDETIITEASGEAKIRIDINRTLNIFDAMYNHLLTYIAHISPNTLDSFAVPKTYLEDGNTYKYFIIPGTTEIPTMEGEYMVNPDNVASYASVSPDGQNIIIDKYNAPNENTTITILVEMTSFGQTSYRTMKFDISGVLLLNRDILDSNLFYRLRQLIDRGSVGNNDDFISRDEIEAADLTEYSQRDSYITSLVGLEYFTSLEKIDLGNNQISDVSPLGALTNLTELVLDQNRIINISKLDTLTNLNLLNLSKNEIIDISNLTYLEALTHLYLDNNLAISDLEPIVNMPNLEYLTVYNTAAVNPINLKYNLNYLITQHDRIGYANAKFYVNNATTIWHPTTIQQEANIIVNYIEPIEEIADVIVLPMQIVYDGIVYPIYWETDATSSGIISIDYENGRAIVTQPISDIDISLYAYIVYGTAPNTVNMYRVMDILSLGDNSPLTLIVDGVRYEDDEVRALIPDPILLQKLYAQFSTAKNEIDIDVLLMNDFNSNLDLNGLGIKDFTGLELFKDVVYEINVSNIFVQDFTPISELENLTSLIATAGNLDPSVLVGLTDLSYLYVYGCNYVDYASSQNMEQYEALGYLYEVYRDNTSNLIRIFQDSSTAWDPYIVPTMDALTALQSLYTVDFNETIIIPSTININMYGVELIPVSTTEPSTAGGYSFSYKLATNRSGLSNYSFFSFNLTTGELLVNRIPPTDTYSAITATLEMYNTDSQVLEMTFRRNIMIMQNATSDLYVQVKLPDGTFQDLPFDGLFGDYNLSRIVADLYKPATPNFIEIDGVMHPYVTHDQLMTISTITFSGINGGSIKGLEYLIGSEALKTLSFTYFRGPGYGYDSEGNNMRVDLSILTSANFPNLTAITFAYSYVYMPDLYDLPNLESLVINDAIRVDFGTDPATMASFTSLKNLSMYSCDIRSFEFIATLPSVEVLNIYNNPASTKPLTDSYVKAAYNNLQAKHYDSANPSKVYPFTYYVISNTVLWSPVDVSKITDFDVTAVDGSGNTVYVEQPGYAGILTVLDIVDTVTILDNGSKVYLPSNVDEWISTSPYIMNISSTDSGGYFEVNVTSLNVRTYVRLIGKISTKILVYAFVIDANTTIKDTAGAPADGYVRFIAPVGPNVPAQMLDWDNKFVIDLDVFQNENGSFDDPSFMNFALGSTNGFILSREFPIHTSNGIRALADNVSGIFPAPAAAADSFNYFYTYTTVNDENQNPVIHKRLYTYLLSNTANTGNVREVRFTSIQGMRAFFRVTALQISQQEVTNIDELRFLRYVTTINITSTRVSSFWYLPNGATDIKTHGRSVFENLINLTSFSAISIPVEDDDYLALIYKTYNDLSPGNKTACGVNSIVTFHIGRTLVNSAGTNYNYVYTNARSLNLVFKEFVETGGVVNSLRLSYQTFTRAELGTQANMNVLLDDIAKFMEVPEYQGTFAIGDTLPTVTVGSSQIYWTTEVGSLITINDAGKITVDTSTFSGKIHIRGAVQRARGITAPAPVITRDFIIDLVSTSSERPNANDAKIELTATEYNLFNGGSAPTIDGVRYYKTSELSVDNSSGSPRYFVNAQEAIPDISLRMNMFNYFDGLLAPVAGKVEYTAPNGIISLTERSLIPFIQTANSNNESIHTIGGQNLNLARRNISDMKGIELFYNVEGFQLAGNPIRRIPKLLLPYDHQIQRLLFYFSSGEYVGYTNSYLNDISNLVFDADGSGSNYRSIAQFIRILDIRTQQNLDGEQFKYLTNLDLNPLSSGYLKDYRVNYSSIVYLRFPTLVTNYKYVPYLPHTITVDTNLRPITNTFVSNGSYSIRNSLQDYDVFCLNSRYGSAKTLTSTKLQDEIDFYAPTATKPIGYPTGYPTNELIDLPSKVTIFDREYYLGYNIVNVDTHQITEVATSPRTYRLMVKPGAPTEISFVVYTRYLSPNLDPNNPAHTSVDSNWIKSTQETVTVKVDGGDIIEEAFLLDCEGVIQFTADGPFEDLRLYVPDPVLRYWIMSYLDWGGATTLATANRDGKISYEELYINTHPNVAFTINSSTSRIRGVSDLTGFDILENYGIKTLSLRYAMTSDFSVLGKFKTIESLTIQDNQAAVHDTSFVNEMTSLKVLNLHNTFYTDMNFLHTNNTIEQLVNINGTGAAPYMSEAVDAQFVRTEWAFARANGKLSELESYMLTSNGSDQSFVSDAEIKLVAEVLNTLTFSFDTELPEFATYNGKVYGAVPGAIENTSLRFVSVCTSIDIDPDTRVATNNGTRDKGLVLAVLEYQGVFYERLFIVDLA